MADNGRQVRYGVGIGADVAPAAWLDHLSVELNDRTEHVMNNSATGRLERTNSSLALRSWAEGPYEEKLTADRSVYTLLGVFGSISTTDNADSNAAVKDHTLNLSQNVEGQPLTFYRKDSLTTKKYKNARLGETTISMALDDYVRISSNVLASKGVTTTATPTTSAEAEFVAKHFSIKASTTGIAGIAAATGISTVESCVLTINPNLRINWEAGSDEPESFTSEGYEVSFELSKRYNDTTFEDAYNNDTELAFQLTLENTDVLIGTAAHPKFVFPAPHVKITDWAKNEELDGPITETMTGTIHFDRTAGYALRAIVTNTTASYA